MKKNLFIQTNASEAYLNRLLARYDVEVVTDEWDYKELVFKTEEYRPTFYEVMRFLIAHEISVTVLDILVEMGSTPELRYYEKFSNWKHGEMHWTDFFDED